MRVAACCKNIMILLKISVTIQFPVTLQDSYCETVTFDPSNTEDRTGSIYILLLGPLCDRNLQDMFKTFAPNKNANNEIYALNIQLALRFHIICTLCSIHGNYK